MKSILKKLVNDTLMKYDGDILRYSRTSLTMFSAWILVCSSYLYDQLKHGFRYEAWVVMVGVALGTKLTDSLSKKINK